MHSIFIHIHELASLGEISLLRHKLTINVTRFNTHMHKHAPRRMKELRKRKRPLLGMTSYFDVI
jgi:hypothetical protein